MGKSWDKFRLLMWKNWLLQYRKPLQTLVEIIAPVLFSILLVIIRSLVDPEQHPARTFDPFCPLPVPILCPESGNDTSLGDSNFTANLSLVYSPSTNRELNATMEIVNNLVGRKVVEGLADARMLEQHFVSGRGDMTLAGIEFDDSVANSPSLPKDLKISLRFPGELRRNTDILGQNNWHTNLIYPVYQTPGPRAANSTTGGSPRYFMEGFLSLQTLITLMLILSKMGIGNMAELQTKVMAGELKIPILKMQRYPHASWIEDPLLQALESFVSLIILLSFVYPCINTVRMITTEKEKQLKEAMKIMGLPNWLHWTAWFLKTFLFLLISIVLVVILVKISWYPNTTYSVFTYANPGVLLLFLVLYICATITFCFAISVFFSKANTASTIAGLLWFLSYSPYLFLQQQYDTLSLRTKLAASLGSNTAMAYGFQLMIMFEGTSEGIQWDNIFRPNTPDDDLTLGLVMMMLVIDAILYLLVALYVEAIFPGEYGVPLPWYFPVSKSYWCGRSTAIGVDDEFTDLPRSASKTEFFESDPDNLHAGVQIRNLCKIFGKKAAVRHLSLNMYDDQITVLLGHNGAGKTTTMSMLTGMFPPTTGTALVNDNDIRTNMDGVRDSLGLCPQHNILFDELTVREHLYFFSKLKGLRGAEIEAEIKTYVVLLELEDKEKAKSSTLSGGMKRKLCVGMALCGNSKVVMLDEPTAGMDPSARRALWDLLQQQKIGRTMLLTTHFMDEADLLGDRIAIMAGGELQCCGSSFFLKKKYGAGYHLIMDKSRDCNPDKVTEILRKHIPNIEIHSNVGSELTYILLESQVSVFENMLRDVENYSAALGVRSYGISLTTLEEVFMKVGADHGHEDEDYDSSFENGNNNKSLENNGTMMSSTPIFDKTTKVDNSNNHHDDNNAHFNSPETKLHIETPALLIGCSLVTNQFLAMLMKKILATWRTWILQLIQILMPVAFLIIAVVVIRNANNTGNLPPLKLTLDSYQDPITLIDDTYLSSNTSLYDGFVKVVQENHHKYEISNEIENDLLNLTEVTPTTARLRYIVGASFLPPPVLPPPLPSSALSLTLITWFNNDPYHSPGLALGLTLNALYKSMLGDDFDLVFYNKPLPFTADTKVQQMMQGNSMGFQLAFNLGFSMAFVSSFYVLFYVRERVCKSKHLQFVSGVKVYVFWLTSYVCDLFTFVVTTLAILITLAAFQEEGFRSPEELGRIFLILLYFGCAVIPMEYCFSYAFDVPSTGYTRMTLFSIFTGVAAFLVVQVLGTPGLDLEYVATSMHWIFLIVPHYSLATGIRDCYMTYATGEMCQLLVDTCVDLQNVDEATCRYFVCHNSTMTAIKDYCCDKEQDYFKWETPGIGRNLTYSFTTGLILFLLLLINEYKVFSIISDRLRKKFVPKKPQSVPDEDDDVLEEKERIQEASESSLQSENIVVLKQVTKYYNKFLAVNGISLAIKQYECFGLLGVNGAGKTTTFKMMTGDVKMTFGNAWVKGYSLRSDLKRVQKLIGYCPQFDALLDDLTAKESLIMFALLRGVPFQDCRHMADKLAKDFDFHGHLNKKVKQLSGGNKRKLSTAISLIGDPPVIYLDEPTTGMDPATKRFLWNALCQVRDAGKCVVLTSHSMEECEALCTRLAIMVNGNFKCLGSTQHLKNKFAEGYTLTIKIKKDEASASAGTKPIETFIQKNFPSAVKREKHQELLTYYIVDKRIPWSRMFGVLEQGKKVLNIEDYSLGQSSLEQVFLTFTKHQIETK